MWVRAAFVLLGFALSVSAIAPAGIPRELARERSAAISNLRYNLWFDLTLRDDVAVGSEELHFSLSKNGPLLLDFRGENAHSLVINGHAAPVTQQNGHIPLPAEFLQRGENTVSLKFDAPIGPSGKAITRYEDKEDGSVYLYTLFVPMDASAAFPCFDQRTSKDDSR